VGSDKVWSVIDRKFDGKIWRGCGIW
jgi:hypothetical protein